LDAPLFLFTGKNVDCFMQESLSAVCEKKCPLSGCYCRVESKGNQQFLLHELQLISLAISVSKISRVPRPVKLQERKSLQFLFRSPSRNPSG